jgi:hypothetical protein
MLMRRPEQQLQKAVLNAALAYAACGLPVFPCLPRAKEPAVARGFHAATTNPETIRRLWRDGSRNIGLHPIEPTPEVRSWVRSRQIAYAKSRAVA